MSYALHLLCLTGFLLLPIVVLWLRAVAREKMPWWKALLLITAFGWLFINGAVHFHFAHLENQMNSYAGNPPEELVDRWANDGAPRVFALFFGWAYAWVYAIPIALVYWILVLVRRHASPTQASAAP